MADTYRATVDDIRRLGHLDENEFTNEEISAVIPVAHSIVMFQMKKDWELAYSTDEAQWAETILHEAECFFSISRLFKIKADAQLDEVNEDAFTIGSISIQPGGAQSRAFNKDYQYLADKYELQGQTLVNLVIPSNTQVFFRVR